MKRTLVTLLALAALAATTLGAVHVATTDARVVCVPPAVIEALS
jgi:hypothetical protein